MALQCHAVGVCASHIVSMQQSNQCYVFSIPCHACSMAAAHHTSSTTLSHVLALQQLKPVACWHGASECQCSCVLICGMYPALPTMITCVLQDVQLASDVQHLGSVVQYAHTLLQPSNSRQDSARHSQAAVQLLTLLASWSTGFGAVFQLWAHTFVSEGTVGTLLAAAAQHNRSLPAAQKAPWEKLMIRGRSMFAVPLGQHRVTLDKVLSAHVSAACCGDACTLKARCSLVCRVARSSVLPARHEHGCSPIVCGRLFNKWQPACMYV